MSHDAAVVFRGWEEEGREGGREEERTGGRAEGRRREGRKSVGGAGRTRQYAMLEEPESASLSKASSS